MNSTHGSKLPNNPVDAIPRLELTEKKRLESGPRGAFWFTLSEQNRGLGEADKVELSKIPLQKEG